MDSLDCRILREVQKDCSRSAADLAELCGTTESTALRRLKRLQQDGVIRGRVALVDQARIGRSLLIFVQVRLERETGPGVAAFIDRVRKNPDVLQFHFVTGTPDYIILLNVRTMDDYDTFLQENLVPDPLTVMSETNVVVRTLKMSTEIRIDESA